MPRTTIEIDAALIAGLKRLAKARGMTSADLIGELLATALAKNAKPERLELRAESRRARVELEDKEALRRALADDE